MNKNLSSAFLFLLVAFLIVLGTASFVAKIRTHDDASITGGTIIAKNDNIIRVPNSNQPVPNEGEGTLVIHTKPPIKIFDQFADTRDYIIFFSSTNIPGLRIVYNIRESRFEAGTPILSTPKVDIFDEQVHQLVYSFKDGEKQAIFLDGVKVAESDFKRIEVSPIVGFSVIEDEDIAESDIQGVEVSIYDRSLPEEKVKEIR